MSILAIKVFLTQLWGLLYTYRRVLAGIGLVLLLVVVGVFLNRACSPKPTPLDLQEIIKAQDAIDKGSKEERAKVLAEIEVKRKEINTNVADGRVEKLNEIDRITKENLQKTNEELAAELERRLRQ